MKYFSMFSGIGGFELGIMRAVENLLLFRRPGCEAARERPGCHAESGRRVLLARFRWG